MPWNFHNPSVSKDKLGVLLWWRIRACLNLYKILNLLFKLLFDCVWWGTWLYAFWRFILFEPSVKLPIKLKIWHMTIQLCRSLGQFVFYLQNMIIFLPANPYFETHFAKIFFMNFIVKIIFSKRNFRIKNIYFYKELSSVKNDHHNKNITLPSNKWLLDKRVLWKLKTKSTFWRWKLKSKSFFAKTVF